MFAAFGEEVLLALAPVGILLAEDHRAESIVLDTGATVVRFIEAEDVVATPYAALLHRNRGVCRKLECGNCGHSKIEGLPLLFKTQVAPLVYVLAFSPCLDIFATNIELAQVALSVSTQVGLNVCAAHRALEPPCSTVPLHSSSTATHGHGT